MSSRGEELRIWVGPDGRGVELEIAAVGGLQAVVEGLGLQVLDGLVVVLVDTYELLEPVDAWLREELIPDLPAGSLVVIAGGGPLPSGWRGDPGWRDLVRVGLGNLDVDDAVRYLAGAGVPHDLQGPTAAATRGHPLALALAVDVIGQRGGAGHVVVFDWLRGLSCMEAGPRGLYPHDLARDVLEADLRWRNPRRHGELGGRILVVAVGRRTYTLFARDARKPSQVSESLPPPPDPPAPIWSREEFAGHVRAALGDLGRVDRLATNPLVGLALVGERGGGPDGLRSVLVAAAELLRGHPRDEKLFRARPAPARM